MPRPSKVQIKLTPEEKKTAKAGIRQVLANLTVEHRRLVSDHKAAVKGSEAATRAAESAAKKLEKATAAFTAGRAKLEAKLAALEPVKVPAPVSVPQAATV